MVKKVTRSKPERFMAFLLRGETSSCNGGKRAGLFSTPLNPALHADQRLARLVFDDISSHRAGRDGQRRSQIHLSRTAAAREVAVLGADHHLIGTRRNPRPCIDASPATRLDHNRPSPLKHVQITLAQAVFPRLLRSKLDI